VGKGEKKEGSRKKEISTMTRPQEGKSKRVIRRKKKETSCFVERGGKREANAPGLLQRKAKGPRQGGEGKKKGEEVADSFSGRKGRGKRDADLYLEKIPAPKKGGEESKKKRSVPVRRGKRRKEGQADRP